MYPVIAGLILVIGVVLFLAASKIGNKMAVILLKAVGGVLAIFSIVALCLLLSGTVTLPLT